MPITVEVDNRARLVHFTVRDALDTAEMLHAISQAAAQLDEGTIYRVLSDNREITTPITPEQLKELIGRLRSTGMTTRVQRAAIVVNNEASYGMMRVFGARTESMGMDVRGFWSLDEALAFLGSTSRAD